MGEIIYQETVNEFQLVAEKILQNGIKLYFLKGDKKSHLSYFIEEDIVNDYILRKGALIGIDVFEEALKSLRSKAINYPKDIHFQ